MLDYGSNLIGIGLYTPADAFAILKPWQLCDPITFPVHSIALTGISLLPGP